MKKNRIPKFAKIFLVVVFVAMFLVSAFLPLSRASAVSASDKGDSLTKLSLSYSLISHSDAAAQGPYEVAVLTGWKICLGLANAFVVLILVFLAIVNIAHINYDVYAIKKALPWLIIGIILANFSLIICRMLIDAANVLTKTFTGPDIGTNIIKPLFNNFGLVTGATDTASAAIISLILGGGTITIALGILLLIIILLPVIAVAVILFLLYIRIAVILFLAMISPIGFVALAFPTTQKWFKEWLSWMVRWTFMKPIMFFFLWAAVHLGANGYNPYAYLGDKIAFIKTAHAASAGPSSGAHPVSFVSYVIALALTYMAFIVPFKLGGAIMAGWGKMGAWLPKKGIGQANKWWGDEKKLRGNQLKTLANRNPVIGGMLANRREELKTAEQETKAAEEAAIQHLSDRTKAEHALRRRRAQEGLEIGEGEILNRTNKIEEGTELAGLTEEDYFRLTGYANAQATATSYMNTSKKILDARNTLEKRREMDTIIPTIAAARNHTAVTNAMKDDLASGADAGVTMHLYDQTGALTGASTTKTYAQMMDELAQVRAKGKEAPEGSTAQINLQTRANEMEQAMTTYRDADPTKYDFDVLLTRNTYGRQQKLLQPWIAAEAEVTKKSFSGRTIVKESEGVHGTAEFRADENDTNKALVGRWEDIEGTASAAEMQHQQATLDYMRQGARGDAEGVATINDQLLRMQKANDWAQTAAAGYIGTANAVAVKRVKREAVMGALSGMSGPQQTRAQDEIAKEQGYKNWAEVASAGIEDAVLDMVDLTRLTFDNTPPGQANKALIESVFGQIEEMPGVGYNASPGPTMTKANSNRRPRG